MANTFQALVVENNDSCTFGVKEVSFVQLPAGEIVYSSVSCKDGLAFPEEKIVRTVHKRCTKGRIVLQTYVERTLKILKGIHNLSA